MNGELLSILAAIERDKGIDREVLIQAVESALATAAKKSVPGGEEQEVVVKIDRTTGRMSVVSDNHEISSMDFSRIAAQTAKQVIIQKIREAERDVIFTEFQGRVGDIVTGTVHRFERGDIIVELGRAEAVLPKSERIPHEDYQQGDRVQGYVLEVRKAAKGPAIVLSRTHEGFIQGLFALEVPEIAEEIVQIKGIAREAGDRTKIAVTSTDDKVDCVGACVGMRGTRVKNIVRELHGEKVDIIRWRESVKDYIAEALSPLAPAKISEIRTADATRQALVIVEDDQLSLAIGKKGQNVRLASKLTGWQLEIKSRVQLTQAETPLRELPGVGETMEARLTEAGITTVQQAAALTLEQLTAIKGIGEKTAQKILEAAQQLLAAKAAAPATEGNPEAAGGGTTEPGTPPEAGSATGVPQTEDVQPTEPGTPPEANQAAEAPPAEPSAESPGTSSSEEPQST